MAVEAIEQIMRIANYLSCLLLALLLPAGLLASGRKAVSAANRGRVEYVAQGPAASERSFADLHGAPQELHVQGLHTLAWGGLPGSGAHANAAHHTFFVLPGSFPTAPGCSKADLRLLLRSTLEHFTYQQRLALYPKHSFW